MSFVGKLAEHSCTVPVATVWLDRGAVVIVPTEPSETVIPARRYPAEPARRARKEKARLRPASNH